MAVAYEPSNSSINAGVLLNQGARFEAISTPFWMDASGRTVDFYKSNPAVNLRLTVTGINQFMLEDSALVSIPLGAENGETNIPFIRVDSIFVEQTGASGFDGMAFGHGSWLGLGQTIPVFNAANFTRDGENITTYTLVNRPMSIIRPPTPMAGWYFWSFAE